MDGEPYEVVNYSQKVVGRGGSIINIKAKNLITGANVPRTFSDSDKFEPADIATSSYDYLYRDGDEYFFMNRESYEQISLDKKSLDGAELFMVEWDKVSLQEFNGVPINVNLEPTTTLEVIDTPPGEKWDSATGWKKPATLITGVVVQVPLFVNIWDKIVVDTRTREYRSRG